MVSVHYSTTYYFALLEVTLGSLRLLPWAGLLYNRARTLSSSGQLLLNHGVFEEVDTVRKILNFLAGFFVGGLTGVVTGLLLAPSSGPDLQEQIQARIDELMEEGRKAAAERQAELEKQLESFKSGESSTVETTSKAV